MSIAVRVSVWILGVLVVVSAAVAVLALMQKQTLQGQNANLQSRLSGDESNLAQLQAKAKTLQDASDQANAKIAQALQDKTQIQNQYDALKQKSNDMQSQLDQANSDVNDWKKRVDTITHDRDTLMEKLNNQPVKVVYKVRVVSPSGAPVGAGGLTAAQGDEYWAQVLREKAALQVEVQSEKSDLDQAALQVADLKKQNSDLETEVKEIGNEKDEIVEKIKYGQDLADNLSIDLARSRNDQEVVNERADKLKQENLQLLSEVRDLNSTKVELEKTVERLTDDKSSMQRKLVETESVIQSRIDDIWKIKQSLDKKLAENAPSPSAGGMELPPIIVNGPAASQSAAEPAAAPQMAPASPSAPAAGGKTEGSIISINVPNNFVISDMGQENSSVSIGNTLKVYRDSNVIATLEVIQVRRDICAADIKNSTTDLRVGDTVRLE